MKKYNFILMMFLINVGFTVAQSSAEQEIKKLSLDKGQWMADKDVVRDTHKLEK